MAGYMLQPLIWQPVFKPALFASILAVAGLHLGWLDRSRGTLRVFPLIKKGVGAFLICGAIISFMIPSPSRQGVHWITYDQTVIRQAIQQKKPVILDFYADWCEPCRAMEKEVFTDPQVLELSRHFVPVRVDLTKRHPHQAELLKHYQVRGVPTIIFMNRDGTEEKNLRIESFVKRNDVLRRMKRLIEKQLYPKKPPSLSG
jgi:thiol:disulfide interchange protein DsbD